MNHTHSLSNLCEFRKVLLKGIHTNTHQLRVVTNLLDFWFFLQNLLDFYSSVENLLIHNFDTL